MAADFLSWKDDTLNAASAEAEGLSSVSGRSAPSPYSAAPGSASADSSGCSSSLRFGKESAQPSVTTEKTASTDVTAATLPVCSYNVDTSGAAAAKPRKPTKKLYRQDMSRSRQTGLAELIPDNARAPVVGISSHWSSRSEKARHTHVRHQLMYSQKDVIRVATPAASWVLPPTRSIWISGGTSAGATRVERPKSRAGRRHAESGSG